MIGQPPSQLEAKSAKSSGDQVRRVRMERHRLQPGSGSRDEARDEALAAAPGDLILTIGRLDLGNHGVCGLGNAGVIDIDNAAPELGMFEREDTRKTPDRRLGHGQLTRTDVDSGGLRALGDY